MSQPNTIVRVKLIKDEISNNGAGFKVVSQRSPYKLFNKVGVRIQCAFFESDGTTLIDPSIIASATHTIVQGNNTYCTQVKAGPFPAITVEQWNDGTGYHVEFAFSDTDTALVAGDYDVVVFGNTTDPLAAVDYCCTRSLTILNSNIPGAFTTPENSATLLAELKAYLDAQLGAYMKKVGDPGDTLTLTSADGAWRRILGVTNEPAPIGQTRTDDLEEVQ
jgi:hypothetical protein